MELLRRVACLLIAFLAVSCSEAPHQPVTTTAIPTPTDEPSRDVYGHTHSGDLDPAVADFPARVYVPNSKSNTVEVIDQTSLRVVDDYAVGTLPQHVTPSWDMKELYVNNNRSNSLTPIDPNSGRPRPGFPVDDPYNLYFTPDGRRAVVVAERLGRIDFRDPQTWKLKRSLAIPYPGPNHLDFTADGRYLLISCEFSGYVLKIDITDVRIDSVLHVGGKPADVRLSNDGTVFFVANERRSGVSVIDPDAMREVRFIPTDAGAHGFVVSRSGTDLYVTNRRAGSISVVNMASRSVVRTWRTGGSPDMGGVSIDGKRLWGSERYDSSVLVVDTTSGEVVARIPVGAEPHGLCVFPQPGRFSLGHTGNYR
jgi:YVTN family beta-propeller protein